MTVKANAFNFEYFLAITMSMAAVFFHIILSIFPPGSLVTNHFATKLNPKKLGRFEKLRVRDMRIPLYT